jgi:2-dehydropantoate 2-reductase
MKNNIYIIGAGAIGKALAVFLKLENRRVFLLRGSVDDKSKYLEKISVELGDETRLAADVEICTLSDFPELDGIIVLTNKSYGNEHLSQSLKAKTGISPIVILQNGLGVEQPFINENFSEIYRCVLFATSQIVAENKLTFKPVSDSPIGVVKGNDLSLNRIVEQISSPHFPFKAESDIQTVIWKKAIINSVFNSICPLLEIDNGVFHREKKALEIGKRVIEECVSIAAGQKIYLETEEITERLLLISKSSDGQIISTLQDIRNKRETEIETLNLEISRLAKNLNMEDKIKETRLLGELTKFKSELNR